MLLRFLELGSENDACERERLFSRARQVWRRLSEELSDEDCVTVMNSRLEVAVSEGSFVVRETEPAARPLAQLFVSAAPFGVTVRWGLEPANHERSLAAVRRRTGIDLSRARVRVGFTRGHLLDIVVQVPLDEEGAADDLQIAAEIYLENRLGDRLLETWVHSIGLDRIARTSGLVLVADSRSRAQNYPLQQVETLVQRGIAAVRSELPESILDGAESILDGAEGEWTALEIPACEGSLQSDRCFASTRFPEALKCALEGMPFDSGRFTRGNEIFVWVRWSAEGKGHARDRLRTEVERYLTAPQFRRVVLLAGTGFGASNDYVDLWVRPDCPELRDIARWLVGQCGPVELGFYDSHWSEERLRFEP